MHKTSLGFDFVGFDGKLTYKRGPSFPVYTLKVKADVTPDPEDDTPADYIDVSLEDVVKAGVIAERSGKAMKLSVKAAIGMTEADVRKKIDALIGDGVNYRQQVYGELPHQNNTALMGGIGLSAGYHYQLPLVICNVRAGADYLWGKFKQFDLYPSSLAQMGFGVKFGTGLDYRLTDKATFGCEWGMRLSAFRNPKAGQSSAMTSWIALPYMQVVCGFSPRPDYAISTFMGYFFPTKFSINGSGGTIPSGTMCKVDGMFGGIRFARYF